MGQGGAALLGLVLIKLGASGFSVSIFGATALLLGLQALVRNTTLNPLLNLAIYTSREEGHRHGLGWVHGATGRALSGLMLLAFPLFLLAIGLLHIPVPQRVLAALVLLALLASEASKTARLNLLHCKGAAHRFALWTLADAASKPAMLLLYLASGAPRAPLALLACHALGSALALTATILDPAIRRLATERVDRAPEIPHPATWIHSHRTFLAPLVGVGITGWVTGLSDRYLVNLILGAESAGLYAGAYALFSAPFLILGTAFTLAIRPRLMALHAEGQLEARNQWLKRGLVGLAIGVVGLALLLYLLRVPLVVHFLRPAYLQALPAAPGILLGNAILTLGTGLEQLFYVTRRTRLVLAKQALGSCSALLIVWWATPIFGIAGVGWACPVYALFEGMFGIMLVKKYQT